MFGRDARSTRLKAVLERLGADPAALMRYRWISQAAGALIFLALGGVTETGRIHLIANGERAQGTIVDWKQQTVRKRPSGERGRSFPSYAPIVEFDANGTRLRFKDWLGSSSAPARGTQVTVLYDPGNPAKAMIDRPLMNWMPWAPFLALGVFLTIAALRSWLAYRRLIG